jgi:hypothetical protein
MVDGLMMGGCLSLSGVGVLVCPACCAVRTLLPRVDILYVCRGGVGGGVSECDARCLAGRGQHHVIPRVPLLPPAFCLTNLVTTVR